VVRLAQLLRLGQLALIDEGLEVILEVRRAELLEAQRQHVLDQESETADRAEQEQDADESRRLEQLEDALAVLLAFSGEAKGRRQDHHRDREKRVNPKLLVPHGGMTFRSLAASEPAAGILGGLPLEVAVDFNRFLTSLPAWSRQP